MTIRRRTKDFDWIVQEVASIPPDYSMDIDARLLDNATACYSHNNANFTPPDQVLENIVGAAYEFSYFIHPIKRIVTFSRLKKPIQDGQRTYVSPDLR